jgi:hypothetical protein
MSGIESSFSSDSTYFLLVFFLYEIGPVTRNIFTVSGIFLVFETRAWGNFSSEFTMNVLLRTLFSACTVERHQMLQFSDRSCVGGSLIQPSTMQ